MTQIASDSITVKLHDGSEMTVPLDASTTYRNSTAGAASDVKVGSTVAVAPGAVSAQPGVSFNPGGGPANFQFGPAEEVTVLD